MYQICIKYVVLYQLFCNGTEKLNSKNERKNIKLQEIIKNLNELKKIITN